MKKIIFSAVSLVALAACSQEGAETNSVRISIDRGDAKTTQYAAEGWMAGSLPEIAAALQSGELTAEEVTAAYIARIESVDWAGPELQSVLALNPNALDDARALDAKR